MRRVALLALILLPGCALFGIKRERKMPPIVSAPNGERGYMIECDRPASCYVTAEKVCPGGYYSVHEDAQTGVKAWGGSFPGARTTSNLTMIFRCGTPPHQVAQQPAPTELSADPGEPR